MNTKIIRGVLVILLIGFILLYDPLKIVNIRGTDSNDDKITSKLATAGYEIEKVDSIKELGISVLDQGQVLDSEVVTEEGDKITVYYRGWRAKDGYEFDSNLNGSPAEFQLIPGSLIKGWVDGLKDMKIGEIRRLKVPSSLAYGTAGSQSKDENGNLAIPPNTDLIFDVELVDIVKK